MNAVNNSGPVGPLTKSWIVEAGICFKQSRRSAPGDWVHPTAVANVVQASSFVTGVLPTRNADDSSIADWKGGLLGCLWRNHVALEAPEDWPMRAMRLGSPPKVLIFVRTH